MILSVRLFGADQDLIDKPGCGAETALGHDHDDAAGDGFSAVSFTSDGPLAVDKFQSFLERDLPVGVFRGKGILWVAESDARYVFHLVGRRFSLDESRWEGPRKYTLVLIGRNLDGDRLRRCLDACLGPVSIS